MRSLDIGSLFRQICLRGLRLAHYHWFTGHAVSGCHAITGIQDLDITHSELWIKVFAVSFKEIRSTSNRPSGFVTRFWKPGRPDRIDRVAEPRHEFAIGKYNVFLCRNVYPPELFGERRSFRDLHT